MGRFKNNPEAGRRLNAHPYSFGFNYVNAGKMKGSWVARVGEATARIKLPAYQQRLMEVYPSAWSLFASEVRFPVKLLISAGSKEQCMVVTSVGQMDCIMDMMRDPLMLLSDDTELGSKLRRILHR
jgi:hypothetical protein